MTKKQLALIAVAITLILTIVSVVILYALNAWWEVNHFVFRPPVIVTVKVQFPIIVEKRKILIPDRKEKVSTHSAIITKPVVATEHIWTDQDIYDYISTKNWDFSVAIRMAKSENFWNLNHHFNCSRTNTNKDGTTDYGVFQINSVHTKRVAKHGWTMEDMKDCQKNIDIAHEIWTEQGWIPWSSYKNGSYLTHDTKI